MLCTVITGAALALVLSLSAADCSQKQELPTSSAQKKRTASGWKLHRLEGKQVFKTDDWDSFAFVQNSSPIPFEIQLPTDWTVGFGESTIDDSRGHKIADLVGIVVLRPAQKCFDKQYIGREDWELLSRERLVLSDLSVVRHVEKASCETGEGEIVCYITTYCGEKIDKAFVISFFEFETGPSPAKRKLFDQVISSFRFR